MGDLILGKPVAPGLAAQLIDACERAGKRYRVGYTFRFLPWAERLRAMLAEGASGVSLEWRFMAHHYRADLESWKRFDASGGGALRFYGIHLIALLAELGYDDVSSSEVAGPSEAETASWEAKLTAKALPPFVVRVDSRAAQTGFGIKVIRRDGNSFDVVDQLDPFSAVKQASISVRDPKVDVLGKLCRSIGEDDMGHAHFELRR